MRLRSFGPVCFSRVSRFCLRWRPCFSRLPASLLIVLGVSAVSGAFFGFIVLVSPFVVLLRRCLFFLLVVFSASPSFFM